MAIAKKKSKKYFSLIQQFGPALMTGIAIIPVGGILLALGTMLTNTTFVSFLPLLANPIIETISTLLVSIGNLIINNISVLFCVSVALGYCKKDGVAGISALVAFLVMNTCINVVMGLTEEMVAVDYMSYTTVLGIPTLNMGVFGGLLCGILTAVMYNKFKDIKLPTTLSFFQGKRFVPIASILGGIVLGLVFTIIWPLIQSLIESVGILSSADNIWVVAFLCGLCCALIPFGLHTIVWVLYAYQMGTYVTISGQTVNGLSNIYFAQLADGVPLTTYYALSYSFITGALTIGLALAMIKEAYPENKAKTRSLLGSGIGVMFLTGISEPITFTYAFQCYPLYLLHSIITAFGVPLVKFLDIEVGSTWGGLMDFIIYGVLQNGRHWWLMIIIWPIICFLYYLFISFLIRKFNLKTCGRYNDESEGETEITRSSSGDAANNSVAQDVLAALGGTGNIESIDACASRLRVTVHVADNVRKNAFKELGASGVMNYGNNYQIVYGTKAYGICDEIKALMENKVPTQMTIMEQEETQKTHKKELFVAPVKGEMVPLGEVPDKIFSEEMVGPGFAIDPEEGDVCSPVSGTIDSVFPTNHAINIISDTGNEIMIHMGLDTVNLKGKPFEIFVKAGDHVEPGTKLATMDINAIKDASCSPMVVVLFTNVGNYSVRLKKLGRVNLKEKDIFYFEEKH